MHRGWPKPPRGVTFEHFADRGVKWNDKILDILEQQHMHVIVDRADDCCFIAASAVLHDTHRLSGSAWRKWRGEDMGNAEFLQYVGARLTSKDVHWPLTLALRLKHERGGYRARTAAAPQRRNEKKARRGFGPLAGRPCGSGGAASSSSGTGRPCGWGAQWQGGDSWWWQEATWEQTPSWQQEWWQWRG